jgi:prevent-host-death family protein
MISVGTYEAKTNLTKLIERVEAGETVLVTRHGKPVARIVPAQDVAPRRSPGEIAAALKELQVAQRPARPGDQPLWKLKHEGHGR